MTGIVDAFVWGKGGKQLSPEEVAREREIAAMVAQRAGDTSPVGHWSAGAARIVDALGGKMRGARADKAEAAGLASAESRMSPIISALSGGTATPQMRGDVIAAQSDPWVSERYGPVMRSLLSALPKYKLGTNYHPGGPAIVGENGPEIAWLPEGASVTPNPATLFAPQGMEREFDALTPEEKALYIKRLNEGLPPAEAMQPDGYDPREMLMEQGALQQPYRVADSGGVKSDALPYGSEKLTEAQSKDIGYFTRGTAVNAALSNPVMENALTQYTDSLAGNFGAIGRAFQDTEYQQAKRAADEFLAVILRKDTGAAITSEEFKLYGPIYLPMPGDKPEVIAAKRKAREIALTGMEMGLGTAAPLGQIAKDKYGAGAGPDLSGASDEDLLKMLGAGS